MNGIPHPVRWPLYRLTGTGLALLILLLPSRGLHAQQKQGVKDIKVPYQLSWGDPVEKVREMLHAVKAQEIGCSEKSPGKVVMEAQGLAIGDPLLKKSLFSFRNGSLVEVELQYGDASWDASKAPDFFDRTRRRIDERYGPGMLLVNKVKETPPDTGTAKAPKDMTYTLIIYQWSQPSVVLELNYTSVEEGTGETAKALRLVSLHYKAP